MMNEGVACCGHSLYQTSHCEVEVIVAVVMNVAHNYDHFYLNDVAHVTVADNSWTDVNSLPCSSLLVESHIPAQNFFPGSVLQMG